MLTRCPHCQTHFRVTAEQLKIRQGKVRCGACQDVFDALDSLSDEALVALPETPAMPDLATEAANEANDPGPLPETGPDSEPEPETASEPGPAFDPEPEPVPEPQAEAEPEESIASATEERDAVPAVPVPPRRWPWIAGIVALLLVAVGQLAYFFRTELVVVAPGLRPALMAGCEIVGCALPRPLKPELVGIEASDLAPEGEALLLTATLKNRAPFEQDFPHLELTLTDTQDAALVRKVLAPADYLPAGQDPAAGFAARGEVAIRLALATDQVPAVGYRLYLFYP
jgi:predicted Zn finger-like uncharacterized protein